MIVKCKTSLKKDSQKSRLTPFYDKKKHCKKKVQITKQIRTKQKRNIPFFELLENRIFMPNVKEFLNN